MDQNERKRKTPDTNSKYRAGSLNTSKKIKAITELLNKEDSDSDDERKRVPSGSLLDVNVREYTYFFPEQGKE